MDLEPLRPLEGLAPRRSLRRILPVFSAVLLLALMTAADEPLGAAKPTEQDSDPGAYGLVDEWRDTGEAMRVVYGGDGLVHVLGGVYIRHTQTNGVADETTRVENITEIAIGKAGDLYAAKRREVMKVRRGSNGTVVWRHVLPTDPHPIIGPRPPYVAAIAWDPFAEKLNVLHDEWELDYNDTKIALYAPEGGPSKRGHALLDAADSYWDMEFRNFNEYILNRSTNQVEIYQVGAPGGSIALPAAAERIAVGPDDTIFFISGRQWIYRVDRNGRLLDVWDATDATPGIQSWAVDLTVDDVGRVYVADSGKASVRVYAPMPGRLPIEPPERPLDCTTKPNKFASPTYLKLGEKTKVTLRLDGNCPSLYEKADIMLVVDRSNSMTGEKIVAARFAVESFVEMMDLKRDKLGMVMFQNEPELLVPLSQDKDAILRAIQRLQPVGGTDISAGLEVGMIEVLGPSHRPDAKPIIVLMTDGVPFNNTRLLTLDTADRARNLGITMYTIGLGGDVDQQLLTIMARSPAHYFFAPRADDLADVYRKIARRIAASVLLKSVTVIDRVPGNMAYQENSSVPPAQWDATARTLTWHFDNVPFSGVEMSFWVEPLEVGEHPTNVGADYEGTDGLDQPARGPFPIPRVVVVSPFLPSPTPTLPPPTVTPTPSPTPTATTVPPTATDPPPPPPKKPVYIPIVFNDKCFQQYTDVVLIIDASTTMKGRMSDGRLKLEGAKDAAKAFLAQLSFEPDNLGNHDQAAIIWYNDVARTEQRLTRDRGALLAAVDRIQDPQQGSRIDLGLSYAHQQLIGSPSRRPGNTQAVVLLSDGEPNHTSIEAVYGAADALKRDRVNIFTVGFRDTYFREGVLRYIASGPNKYYYSPTAEQLAGIYEQIARGLVCRGGR
jgi:Mg-chelatase subunit ChlD